MEAGNARGEDRQSVCTTDCTRGRWMPWATGIPLVYGILHTVGALVFFIVLLPVLLLCRPSSFRWSRSCVRAYLLVDVRQEARMQW